MLTDIRYALGQLRLARTLKVQSYDQWYRCATDCIQRATDALERLEATASKQSTIGVWRTAAFLAARLLRDGLEETDSNERADNMRRALELLDSTMAGQDLPTERPDGCKKIEFMDCEPQ